MCRGFRFEYKEALERKYGSDAKTPNVLTIMLLASIYNTSEENIRLHADHKENPIVEVYVARKHAVKGVFLIV